MVEPTPLPVVRIERLREGLMTEEEIVTAVTKHFKCFGGGDTDIRNNPISAALAGRPPMFAAGVDVADVVTFILQCAKVQKR